MTASQRRYLRTGLMLGSIITLLVVAADAVGLLSGLEYSLYNQRARRCQTFAPAPTTQLVHLDIDDESIEQIGVLPWPRTIVADAIDQLRILGARVIVLDMIMPDPQTQPGDPVDHDAALAAAIQRHGRVLVPLSVAFGKQDTSDPKTAWLVARFEQDLETPLATVEEAGIKQWGKAQVSHNLVIFAREEAARRAVTRAFAEIPPGGDFPTIDQVGRKLLPSSWGTDGAGSAKLKDSLRAYLRREQSRTILRSLARTAQQPPPGTLRATNDLPPIPPLASAAAYTGVVDHLPFDDGVVRAVPLWVENRGTLFPFMGLRMACAMLDVPLDRLTIEPHQVTIPKNDGTRVLLPTIDYPSKKTGQVVSLLFRVPWFGGAEWETMYDWPDHKESRQHLPFGLIWQATKSRRAAVDNNRIVDKALKQLVEQSNPDEARKFLEAQIPPEDMTHRLAVTAAVIKEFDEKGWVAAFREIKPEERRPDETSWIHAYEALERAKAANELALKQEAALAGQLSGKAILVGSVASAAADFVPTPLYPQCPGAIVHGAVFNAVMTNYVWRDVPGWVNVATTLLVGLLVSLAVARLPPAWALATAAALVLAFLAINGYLVFGYGRYVAGAAGPTVAGALVWGGVTVGQYFIERMERQRITERFSYYADQQLVDYFLEHPELQNFEGREQELTVAFTDMKGFTSLMERLGKQVVPLLNEYMGRMVPIIQKKKGYVNKFLGDGVMFFYGAPLPNHEHAIDAVDAVLEMQSAVADFNLSLADRGLDPVAVRAGINTGFMIVGDAGAPPKRGDYTVLGDSVNLAARLESANKFFGTSILITHRTTDLLDNRFLLRPVGRVRVVGKTEWVMTYEPLARKRDATPDQTALAAATNRIVQSFLAADFPACAQAATDAATRFGPHKLFDLYLTLSTRHTQSPPPHPFDGVVELSEK